MADLKTMSGGKALVFARVEEDQANASGVMVAYQTTYSYKRSKDSKTEDTKTGKVLKGGAVEATFSLELLASKQEIVTKLDNAFNDGKNVQFWIVYTDTPGTKTGTYVARSMTAVMTSVEETGDSDNSVSLKIEASVEGGYAASGEVVLNLDDDKDKGVQFIQLGKVTENETSNSSSAPTPTK
ncbi:hypothetical protein R54839_PPFHFPJH_00857 [Fructobacillus fructosus]|uniref:Phage major tail protein, TP901-1 family n=1 Tax=Fructobacillus fructosus TaxID=1631 RepID=A0ABM9MU62_9LACO|nr:hypothetical protein R54839_PPFHFPJH_00857 [Fructobacillus fructosus]